MHTYIHDFVSFFLLSCEDWKWVFKEMFFILEYGSIYIEWSYVWVMNFLIMFHWLCHYCSKIVRQVTTHMCRWKACSSKQYLCTYPCKYYSRDDSTLADLSSKAYHTPIHGICLAYLIRDDKWIGSYLRTYLLYTCNYSIAVVDSRK